MASKELQNIIKQKLDNPIDINLPVELRRKQLEDNAIKPPEEASIERVKASPIWSSPVTFGGGIIIVKGSNSVFWSDGANRFPDSQ